jgi:predicted transcriptional regulator
MKNLKKTLQSVNKDLNALSKKVDRMIVVVGKLEKAKTKVASDTPAKKVAVKKPAAKKPVKLTAADAILRIINKRKKGVGTAELMKKTGFNQKKTYNIVYKLKNQGKIKSEGKGVYVKA